MEKSASTLNSFALRCAQKHEFVNAVRFFQQSLAVARDHVGENGEGDAKHEFVYGMDYALAPLVEEDISGLSLQQGHDGALTFYNHVFIFSNNVMKLHPDMAAAMIIYNMATVIHFQGIVTNNSKCFHKANKIYRMSLLILQKYDTNDMHLTLLSVVCNNMGHASLATQAHKSYQWCVCRLQSLYEFLSTASLKIPLDEIAHSVVALNVYANFSTTAASA